MGRWLGILCCWLGLVQAIAANEEPAKDLAGADAVQRAGVLLARMAQAVRSLNYEGTLVYLHENRLDALNLTHHVEQGQVRERLISLSGPVRAVARAQDRVMCVLPDGHPISVERGSEAGFLDAQGIDPDALGAHYRVELLGAARIAGRDTDVVGIIPRDALRYGYRFHIDRATALPLKSDLIDQGQEPLEQLMFTSIDVQPPGDPAPASAARSVRSAPPATSTSQWRFEAVPAGFELVMQHRMPQPDGSNVEHFLFTDRLSSYSVYVEPHTDEGLEGVASIGAVHAAGREVDGHQVIAVGEVPTETVQAAIAGARCAPPPSPKTP